MELPWTPRRSLSWILLLAGVPWVTLPLTPDAGMAALSLESVQRQLCIRNCMEAASCMLLPSVSPLTPGCHLLHLFNLAEGERKPPPPGVMSQGLHVQMKPVLPAPGTEDAALNASPSNSF